MVYIHFSSQYGRSKERSERIVSNVSMLAVSISDLLVLRARYLLKGLRPDCTLCSLILQGYLYHMPQLLILGTLAAANASVWPALVLRAPGLLCTAACASIAWLSCRPHPSCQLAWRHPCSLRFCTRCSLLRVRLEQGSAQQCVIARYGKTPDLVDWCKVAVHELVNTVAAVSLAIAANHGIHLFSNSIKAIQK